MADREPPINPVFEEFYSNFQNAIETDNQVEIDKLWSRASESERLIMLAKHNYRIFTLAAGKGNLNLLKRFWEIASKVQRDMMLEALSYYAFEVASGKGHLDVVIWLCGVATPEQRAAMLHYSFVFPYQPIISAARNEHLEVVKTLLAYISGTTFTSVWHIIANDPLINPQTKNKINSIKFQGELNNLKDEMARFRGMVKTEVQTALLEDNLLIPDLINIVDSYIPSTEKIVLELNDSYTAVPSFKIVSIHLTYFPQIHVPIKVPNLRLIDAHSPINTPTPPQPNQVVIEANALLREAMGLPPLPSQQPAVPPTLPSSLSYRSASSNLSHADAKFGIGSEIKVEKTESILILSNLKSLKPSSSSLNYDPGVRL